MQELVSAYGTRPTKLSKAAMQRKWAFARPKVYFRLALARQPLIDWAFEDPLLSQAALGGSIGAHLAL